MNYGYIRVSTDKQSVENQRFEILNFANEEKLQIDHWIEETVSGTKLAQERKLGKLLDELTKGDRIVVSELSRLGRSLLEVMEILSRCTKKEVFVCSIKEKFNLDNSINSQLMAVAFSISAQIERQLISQRTKEALSRKRHEGKRLGRPEGSKNKVTKLTGKEAEISELVAKKVPMSVIGRIYGVNRATVKKLIMNK